MSRGVVEYGLLQTVGAILALIMITTLFYVGVEYARPFFFASKEPSLANVDSLATEINRLMEDPTRNAMDKIPLYLEDDKTLIGFSSTRETLADDCLRATLDRPDQCGSSSCLCLYQHIGPKKLPLKCIKTPRVKAFYSVKEPSYHSYGGEAIIPSYISSAFPDSLVTTSLHGACSEEWFPAQFGVKTVYLEEHQGEFGTSILLTPSTPEITLRYNAKLKGLGVSHYMQAFEDNAYYWNPCSDLSEIELKSLNAIECYDRKNIANLYTDFRKFHANERLSEEMLLNLAGKLGSYQKEAASAMYTDFIQWYPGSEHLAEVYYKRAALIKSATSLPLGVRVLEKDLVTALDDINKAIEQPYSPYQHDAHIVRAYYHAAIGKNAAAYADLEQYNRIAAQRAFMKSHEIAVEETKKEISLIGVTYNEAARYLADHVKPEYAAQDLDIQRRIVEAETNYEKADAELQEQLRAVTKTYVIQLDGAQYEENVLDPQLVVLLEPQDHRRDAVSYSDMLNKEYLKKFEDAKLTPLIQEIKTLKKEFDLNPEVDLYIAKNIAIRYNLAHALLETIKENKVIYDSNLEYIRKDISEEDRTVFDVATNGHTTLEYYEGVTQELKGQLIDWNTHILTTNPSEKIKVLAQEDLERLGKGETRITETFDGKFLDAPYSVWESGVLQKENIQYGVILAKK